MESLLCSVHVILYITLSLGYFIPSWESIVKDRNTPGKKWLIKKLAWISDMHNEYSFSELQNTKSVYNPIPM